MKKKNNPVHTILIGIVLLTISISCGTNIAGEYPPDEELLSEQDFLAPPAEVRPWVYYWWLKGNVTKELITRDLEEMQKKGIGGFLLIDSRGYWDDYYGRTGHIPVPLEVKYEFMSDGWREMVNYTMKEANRLGLKMSINLANTGGSLRGPWDMKEDGPKQLIWTAGDVTGPATIEAQLAIPAGKKYFKDVSLIAVRKNPGTNTGVNNPAPGLDGEWSVVSPPTDDAAMALEIVNLNDHLDKGVLRWEAPEGEWRIVRFGYHVIGDEGSVDILNAEAVTKYFNLMGAEVLKDAGRMAVETLTHFYNVSWEGGQPDWTVDFETQFQNQRGYAIDKFMPVLAGMSLENDSLNERFMRDYLKSVSECFIENCYKTIGRLCHENGILWHSENGGPWPRQAPMFKEADQLAFWGNNDMPQGEFWSDSHDILEKKSNVRYTAMAAHIYGRPLISVEAFTHMTNHWTMYPAYLKPFADINFVDGANFFIWHTFTASPIEAGKPGYEYFAGTHINPNVTWFNKAGDFFKYLARCQYLLRKGKYAADYCYYVSDKNYVTWGRGNEWKANSLLHPLKGTKYDLLSSEVITDRMSVEDGLLMLPDGMSYKLLVLDPDEPVIPLQVLKKVKKLVEEGATLVLGKTIPESTPGMENHQNNDREVKSLAEELWGSHNNKKQTRSLGKGTIYTGYNLDEVLADMHILPDFEGSFEFVHRKSSNSDIFFISGEGKEVCTFNVDGKKPEMWNPVTGEISEAISYNHTQDGRTQVLLNLPENGSAFVVFREKSDNNYFTKVDGPDIPEAVRSESEQPEFIFWKTGPYRFTKADGQSTETNIKIVPAIEFSSPWQVQFEPASGAEKFNLTFDDLVPWNEHNDNNIKYFAGTATYTNTFELTASQAGTPVRLNMGDVHNIAQVWLNGNDLGIIWTKPWIVDLSEHCREGANELTIEVTNCWANRLIGDASLPEAERTTSTNVRLVPDRSEYKQGHQATSAADPLMDSGLTGPVLLEFGHVEAITFK